MRKSRKLDTFHYFSGPVLIRQVALIVIRRAMDFICFCNFQTFDFEINEKRIQTHQNPLRGTQTRRATRRRATRGGTSVASIENMHFCIGSVWHLPIYIYIICYREWYRGVQTFETRRVLRLPRSPTYLKASLPRVQLWWMHNLWRLQISKKERNP